MNNMGSLADTLTASGGTESAGFLNDIVKFLWPNINTAGCNMVKQIVEPMFKQTLPGPLSSLHFVKLDLGPVPLHLSKVDVHRTDLEGIKLDMDVDWDGKCDIELDGNMVPKVGIEHVKLHGRFSILLCPITDVIPLIGALQISFINPPSLKLDFTDALSFADIDIIEDSIVKVVLDILGGMLVLPNRMLVKMDASNDWFKTYVPHIGILRLTVEGATGVAEPKKKGAARLLQKITPSDTPDCYCKVSVGAEEPWRTPTKNNQREPTWNETHDFLVMDSDQVVVVNVQDDDVGDDDDVGVGVTTTKQLLLSGGSQELGLVHRGKPTDGKVKVHAKFYNLVADPGSLSARDAEGEGLYAGLATVLVASAHDLQGERDKLNPSVKVTFAGKEYSTAAQTYSEGIDIFNPSFDKAFQIPITAAMLNSPGSFKISLMNKGTEVGSREVAFKDVSAAKDMVLQDSFDMGSGASVRASINLRGKQLAK
ncbi:hypothetical protein GGR56DRAFT_313897 [Xylariaceae sp. FL0804]|nr:hypothetical protein GGR56DRAFT_313897 [Xylariaceae sp. FL0804]